MGLATARMLASRGAILSLADANAAGLEVALISLPGGQEKHMTTTLDVRSTSAVKSWIDATVERFGILDGAANIAGVLGDAVPIRESTEDQWDFVMGVNAKGIYNCLRAQLNNIKEGGSIVNFASVASLVAVQSQAPYVASKHAVLGLTKTAAREEGSRGVRINCVAPGAIKTPIMKDIEEEELHRRTAKYQCFDRIADPDEVAHLVLFLLSDETKFITAACYEISGGWTA
ncbi:uncharacterized protein A1O9_09925 [Exophiala aquamarina CBS 119918]|uniref:Oxidoreductase n=1 Tax=Exophiala aquamarina CBS 119918 TaxID=1182545 RepID=A0A072PEW9_9EURO|nr:uncharacterized protein A1O9_09925 [Exophiala aquamarina CBS 119918]KEF54130.1 hypothetical protein A1O9_09925 [Exophiala aquamarina CBS 119918]